MLAGKASLRINSKNRLDDFGTNNLNDMKLHWFDSALHGDQNNINFMARLRVLDTQCFFFLYPAGQ